MLDAREANRIANNPYSNIKSSSLKNALYDIENIIWEEACYNRKHVCINISVYHLDTDDRKQLFDILKKHHYGIKFNPSTEILEILW